MINEVNTTADDQNDSRVEYLPYATDYMNAACYCLETLNGVDGKLFGKEDEERIRQTRSRMLRVIHSAAKALHDDWFESLEEK